MYVVVIKKKFLQEIANKWQICIDDGVIDFLVQKKNTGPIFMKFLQTDGQYSREYSNKIWRWFERMGRYEKFLLPEIVNKWRSNCFLGTMKQKILDRFSRNFRWQIHNILEYIPLKFGDDSRRCVRYENFLLPEIVNKRRGDWFWSTIKQKLLERFTRNFRRQTHNILKFIIPKYSFTWTKMWLWDIFISPPLSA